MLTKGNIHTDERGTLSFVNEFNLQQTKRFYTVTHPDVNIIRAWQGHKIETKHFFVTKGSFLFGWVKPDNWETPLGNLIITKQVLSANEPCVLTIHAGYANGFKALEENSTVIVFSDCTLEESTGDMYRFHQNTWTL